MGHLNSRKYFKSIKRIVRFPEAVARVDQRGCIIIEADGFRSWSFFRNYRYVGENYTLRYRTWSANDTP